MPFPNDHACRLHPPENYDRFARKNCDIKHDGKCIDVVYGIKDNKSEIQSFRYPKEIWTAEAARSHCEAHEGSFEEASGEESQAKSERKWYAMEQEEDSAEISIFDEIGGGWLGGQNLADFKQQFDQVKDKKAIKVRINSPGGDVFDGMAIYNLLAGRRSKVSVEILGVAASIASIIALAGKELVMGEGSYLMIHNPSGFCLGEASEMRKIAGVLEKMEGQLANIYASRSSLTKEDALKAMSEETWYTAGEALEAGFADAVLDHGPAKAAFDLGRFNYRKVPEDLKDTRMAACANCTNTQDPATTATVGTTFIDSSESAIEKPVEATSLNEEIKNIEPTKPEPPKIEPQGAEPAKEPDFQAEIKLRDERIALLTSERDALASELAQMKTAKLAVEKATTIEAALKAGKILPINREQWESIYDKDPEGTRILLERQPPVVDFAVRGSGAGGEEATHMTPDQKKLFKEAFKLSDERIEQMDRED